MNRILVGCLLAALAFGPAAAAEEVSDLAQLSLEQLANLEVTSVSKAPEPVAAAPAAVYVITRDDVRRAGATTLPEALRLAPNLQVAQDTSSAWTVAPRGFAGNVGLQSFANKLLVLIDGRTVYSPLYSGVYWDAQDVVLDDLDRIEVISGPGATLWGANAVNGVVNVITRSARDTAGGLAVASGGTHERSGTVRFGAPLGPSLDARVYVQGFGADGLGRADGSRAEDSWSRVQAGFRIDGTRGEAGFTFQGDAYRGWHDQPGPLDLAVEGANLLGRFTRTLDGGSTLQVQAYVDETERREDAGGVAFRLRTFDVQVQHSFVLGRRQRIVWGLGERINRYRIRGTSGLSFDPPARTLDLGNVFLQDTVALRDDLRLTLGAKLEDDPYSGWTVQPDVRLAWTPRPELTWWAAGSHAVRAPTPFDVDVVERFGGAVGVRGNPTFRPERVDALELGYRGRPWSTLSLSVSAFWNDYDALRSIEPDAATGAAPYTFGNGLEGTTRGVDAWASWQVTPHWRLKPGARWLTKNLSARPGAVAIGGADETGLDVRSQWRLTSSLDLGAHGTLDATWRRQGAAGGGVLPAYDELDVRAAWQLSPALEVALVGRNLLHARHLESTVPGASEIPRTGLITLRATF
jgi:iron complex outermembrane receptor protein